MKALSFFFAFFLFHIATAQNEIQFENPSFEGVPMEGGLLTPLPDGWLDCGFRGETTPDVHPVLGGSFSVAKAPFNGATYLGMVTRDNDTWEKVGQQLNGALQKNRCYEFSIYLARSELYLSASRVTGQPTNYIQPIKLKIYGGNEVCGKEELLAETGLIKNTQWLEYFFNFTPSEEYQYIVFEAYYDEPTLFPYSGNILLDNLSSIKLCDTQPESGIYFPTAFSPNNDGINDFFTGYGSPTNSSVISSMKIFDRWGNLVFSKSNFSLNQDELGWNGMFKGKPLDGGVYTYLVEIDKEIIESGSINLIR